MKKITKKENKAFIKECESLLILAGGEKVDTSDLYYGEHFIFENESLGKLAIKIDEENSSCYSIYTKFENEKLAYPYFDCNPHSGKYNLHTYYADEPKHWLEKLLYQFKNYSEIAV